MYRLLPLLLIVGVVRAGAPAGWEQFVQGPPGTIDSKAPGLNELTVPKGGMVGYRQELPEGPPFYAIRAELPAEVPAGAAAGVFLNTADGALVKVERLVVDGQPRGRFTALAGEKEFGKREVKVPAGELAVQLIRQADRFTARALAGGKTVEIASLKWPNLAKEGQVGVLAHNAAAADPVIVKIGHTVLETRLDSIRRAEAADDWEAFSGEYRKALAIWADDPLLYHLLHYRAMQFGKHEDAIAIAEKLLVVEPDKARAKRDLAADLVAAQRDLPRAVQLATEAAAEAPDSASYAALKARVLAAAGQHAAAVAAAEDAIARLERKTDLDIAYYHTPYVCLAEVCTTAGRADAARAAWQRLLDAAAKAGKVDNNSHDFFEVVLARAHQGVGDNERALGAAKKAVALADERSKRHPAHVQFFVAVGDVYAGAGNNDAALESYLEARRLAKQFGDEPTIELLKPKMAEVLQ